MLEELQSEEHEHEKVDPPFRQGTETNFLARVLEIPGVECQIETSSLHTGRVQTAPVILRYSHIHIRQRKLELVWDLGWG